MSTSKEAVGEAVRLIEKRAGKRDWQLAIVLGSGLGDLVHEMQGAIRIPFGDLPGFPQSGVSGHAGELVLGDLRGASVILFAGRAHYYETGNPAAMAGPIATLAELGCPVLALSNAAGSTRKDMPPGSLMEINDHLNWSGLNPLIGLSDDLCGHFPSDRRFVDMSNAYNAELRERLKSVAKSQNIPLHSGVYAWFSGPSFETPAEIKAISTLGADAVGMSTVPETILARFFAIDVVAVSMITNFAAGMSDEKLSHAHTKREADKAKSGFISLYASFAESFAP